MQKHGEVTGHTKSLFLDSSQQINADGDPDMRLDSVGRCSVKYVDAQMLLDPAEEELLVKDWCGCYANSRAVFSPSPAVGILCATNLGS